MAGAEGARRTLASAGNGPRASFRGLEAELVSHVLIGATGSRLWDWQRALSPAGVTLATVHTELFLTTSRPRRSLPSANHESAYA